MVIIRTRIGNMIYFHLPIDTPFDPQEDEYYIAVNLDEGACVVDIREGYVERDDLLALMQMLVDANNALILDT